MQLDKDDAHNNNNNIVIPIPICAVCYAYFTSLSNEKKIFWMLKCEDQSILASVGEFIYDHMP
jgi:hypothetical protein